MDTDLRPNRPSILLSKRASALYRITMSMIITVLLITSTVRFVTNNVPIYLFLFERYGVEENTGIPRNELSRISSEFQHYFSSDTRSIDIEAEVYGVKRKLFSQDELLHMVDVKELFNLVWAIQFVSIVLTFCGGFLVIIVYKSAGIHMVINSVKTGAVLAAGMTILFAIVSLAAFGPLFTLFHEIGFRNDLWKLDSKTSFLVQIFPFGFWRDIAIIVSGLILVESLILIVAARVSRLFRINP